MLLQLGLLPSFSDEIIRLVAAPDNLLSTAKNLRDNLFVQYSDGNELYHFQTFYHQYLTSLAPYLVGNDARDLSSLRNGIALQKHADIHIRRVIAPEIRSKMPAHGRCESDGQLRPWLHAFRQLHRLLLFFQRVDLHHCQ